MGTVAEKLSYLNDTKSEIKKALLNKGATVADSDTFRSYATKINALNVTPNEWTALPAFSKLRDNLDSFSLEEFSWGALPYLKQTEGVDRIYSAWKGTSKSLSFSYGGVTHNCKAKLVSSNYNGKEGLVFFVTGFALKYGLFSGGNTEGGWGASAFRTRLGNEIYPQLPQDLTDILQTNSVYYGPGGQWLPDVASAANTKTCTDILFVPSLGELKGNSNFTHNNVNYTLAYSEGTQFQWFSENAEQIAPTENMMTRTCTDANRYAYIVENSTTANCAWGNTATSVAFCFVV